jgi:hypothetical protein
VSPTPEETGVSKPRRGRCESCGGPRGVRRRMRGYTDPRTAPAFVLCAGCARKMADSFQGHPVKATQGHRHGGRGSRKVLRGT